MSGKVDSRRDFKSECKVTDEYDYVVYPKLPEILPVYRHWANFRSVIRYIGRLRAVHLYYLRSGVFHLVSRSRIELKTGSVPD